MTKKVKKLFADAIAKYNERAAYLAQGEYEKTEGMLEEAYNILLDAADLYFESTEGLKELSRILKEREGQTGKGFNLVRGLDFAIKDDGSNVIVLWCVFEDVYGNNCIYWRTFPEDDTEKLITKKISEPLAEKQKILMIPQSAAPGVAPTGMLSKVVLLSKQEGKWQQTHSSPYCFCAESLERIKKWVGIDEDEDEEDDEDEDEDVADQYWEEDEEYKCECDWCNRITECTLAEGNLCLVDKEKYGDWTKEAEDGGDKDDCECNGCERYEECLAGPRLSCLLDEEEDEDEEESECLCKYCGLYDETHKICACDEYEKDRVREDCLCATCMSFSECNLRPY